MTAVYEEYMKMEKALTFEDMRRLHQDMLTEIGDDGDSLELYEELVQTANRYSEFRSNWLLWSHAEKMEQDFSRTACHNSLIVKFNQLARYLRMQEKPAAWRDELGYEEDDKYNRKRIGDFGCYLVFVNSICAR